VVEAMLAGDAGQAVVQYMRDCEAGDRVLRAAQRPGTPLAYRVDVLAAYLTLLKAWMPCINFTCRPRVQASQGPSQGS
jgi:hypothetical protein